MKIKSILLWATCAIVVGSLMMVGYVWYTLQSVLVDVPEVSATTDSAVVPQIISPKPITDIPSVELSPTQKNIADTFGINTENVQITPAMVLCAEAKIGVLRVTEIKNGSIPSLKESLALAGCYKAKY